MAFVTAAFWELVHAHFSVVNKVIMGKIVTSVRFKSGTVSIWW